MLFYRNILSQNLFTYLPCFFIVTFCHKTYSPTYHGALSQHFVTKFVHLPTMLFYRNILSQKLYSPTYHGALSQHFVTKFVHLPTMLFYRNILSQKCVHLPNMLFYR